VKGGSLRAPLPPLSVSGKTAPSGYGTVGATNEGTSKNKNLNGFVNEIQQITPKKHYMLNKLLNQAHKNGYKTFEDLPEDYVFGERKGTGTMLAAAQQHDLGAILGNQFAENPFSMSIEQARKLLTEKKTVFKEKYGRPTHSSVLRDQHIASNMQAMQPVKGRPAELKRPGSSLHMNENGTPMVRKKNARNLMIVGSASAKNIASAGGL